MKLNVLKFTLRGWSLIVFLFFSILNSTDAMATDIIYSNGETFIKVLDLPKDYEMEYNERVYHADLGIKFYQFSLFWIPLFNYGEKKYVYLNERKDDYVFIELTSDDVSELQDIYGSSVIPSDPELPFWDVWGGKMVLILIIIVWFGYKRIAKDDNTDE